MTAEETPEVRMHISIALKNLLIATLHECRMIKACRLAKFAVVLKNELLKPQNCWMHAPEARHFLTSAVFKLLQDEELLAEMERTFLIQRDSLMARVEYAWRVVFFQVIAPTQSQSEDEEMMVLQNWFSYLDVTAAPSKPQKVMPLCSF